MEDRTREDATMEEPTTVEKYPLPIASVEITALETYSFITLLDVTVTK